MTSRPYKETLCESLNTIDAIVSYLDAAWREDEEAFVSAIRSIAEVYGVIEQAKREEREACAMVCESLLTRHGERRGGSNTGDAARKVCAAAIRNREPA